MGAKVLFIGNYADNHTYDLITKKGIRDLSQAARLFQRRLINNLSELCDNFKAVSLLPTDKNTSLPKTLEDTETRVEVIPLINGSVKSIAEAIWRLCSLVKHECGEGTKVLMYAVNPIALIPLLTLKKDTN